MPLRNNCSPFHFELNVVKKILKIRRSSISSKLCGIFYKLRYRNFDGTLFPRVSIERDSRRDFAWNRVEYGSKCPAGNVSILSTRYLSFAKMARFCIRFRSHVTLTRHRYSNPLRGDSTCAQRECFFFFFFRRWRKKDIYIYICISIYDTIGDSTQAGSPGFPSRSTEKERIFSRDGRLTSRTIYLPFFFFFDLCLFLSLYFSLSFSVLRF